MGIDELKKVVKDICDVLNSVSRLIAKEGLLSLYPAVGAIQDLIKVDYKKVKDEILDLDSAERADLNKVIAASLQLKNPVAQQKLLDSVDCIEQVVDLAHYAVDGYNRGKVIVDRVKRIVSGQ
jgi:hypothetical protein